MSYKPNGELRLRNQDAGSVERVKQLAEKAGVSVSAFLRPLINRIAMTEEMAQRDDVLIQVAAAIKENTMALKELQQLIINGVGDIYGK